MTPTSLDACDAVVFDLDGVITRTASIHAAAWKQAFDSFLEQRAAEQGGPFVPFDSRSDYLEYVDGKPRYEGVKSFLESRGIELPFGDPTDPPSNATVTGLGNRKNEAFRRRIEERGADVYQPAVALVLSLRHHGVKVGLVTSSSNGPLVLEATGLEDLFDVVVDGGVAAELGLKGKPDPDTFLEASRRLDVGPDRSALFEDALSGVQAGRAGGYALVVGVDRHGDAGAAMLAAGADLVVRDLMGFAITGAGERDAVTHDIADLPSALSHLPHILNEVGDRQLVIFLDYDGTLTPIVDKPEWAVMPPDTQASLDRLARRFPVAVVSGRDLDEVRELVGLDDLIYAGSHGFDVLLASGERQELGEAEDSLPALDRVEKKLEEELGNIEGSLVERKRYSVAVHYRLVADPEVERVEKVVEEVAAKNPELKRTGGKKVFELRPGLDWHKGKAVGWILETLKYERTDVFPLFLGDDLTDEDAFEYLSGWGVGIVVRDLESRPTHADFMLEDPDEVRQFLEGLMA